MPTSNRDARMLLDENEAMLRRHTAVNYGATIVLQCHSALKALLAYGRQNPAFLTPLREAYWAIDRLLTTNEHVELKVIDNACFCNGALVRPSANDFSAYKSFVRLMTRRHIGQLTFHHGVTEHDLATLLAVLIRLDEQHEEHEQLVNERLAEHGVQSIEAHKPDTVVSNRGAMNLEVIQRQAQAVYFSTINTVRELLGGPHSSVNLRRTKRLMLDAIDLLGKDESALLSLAGIKSYDAYTYSHSVNVAIYAVALGNRLGLSKKELSYLGIAALFHDIGKTAIDKSVLNKPGVLTPEEWEVMRSHPLRGAGMIMRLKGWNGMTARVVAVTCEHHMRYNMSGYPRISNISRPTLFSRIIAIADCYDALARPRVYRQTPFVSEKVVSVLSRQSGTHFDPILVKVFINMIGIYLLGALVLLNTGEMGIVTRTPDDPALFAQPEVCLVEGEAGNYRRGETVDLSKTDEHGLPRRSIVQVLNPNDYQLRIEELFISFS